MIWGVLAAVMLTVWVAFELGRWSERRETARVIEQVEREILARLEP